MDAEDDTTKIMLRVGKSATTSLMQKRCNVYRMYVKNRIGSIECAGVRHACDRNTDARRHRLCLEYSDTEGGCGS